jgi:hypothetical protein
MKFVLEYTLREGGSAADNEAGQQRAQDLLGKFVPSGDVKEWVQRVDGEGGFAVLESDDGVALSKDFAIWSPFLRFKLHPVVDIGEATGAEQEAIEFRNSIS